MEPFIAQNSLKVLDGILAGEEGKQIVCELMEGHSIPEEVSSANEDIELPFLFRVIIVWRVWKGGN